MVAIGGPSQHDSLVARAILTRSNVLAAACAAVLASGCAIGAGQASSFAGTGKDRITFEAHSDEFATRVMVELTAGEAEIAIVDPTGKVRQRARTAVGSSPIDLDIVLAGPAGTWEVLTTWRHAEGSAEISLGEP